MAFEAVLNISKRPIILIEAGTTISVGMVVPKPILQLNNTSNILRLPIIQGTLNSYISNNILTKPSIFIQTLVPTAYTCAINIKLISITSEYLNATTYNTNVIIPTPNVSGIFNIPNIYNYHTNILKPVIQGVFGSNNTYILSTRLRYPLINITAALTSNLAKQTWVFNTITTAHSRYTNYDFDSYFSLGTKSYGLGTDGAIYEFGYNADLDGGVNEVPIEASIILPISSFGEQQAKVCSDAFVFARADGDLEVSVVLDEEQEREGFVVLHDDRKGVHRKRVKIPKGLHSNVWQFKIKNTSGCAFSINSFETLLRTIQRIR